MKTPKRMRKSRRPMGTQDIKKLHNPINTQISIKPIEDNTTDEVITPDHEITQNISIKTYNGKNWIGGIALIIALITLYFTAIPIIKKEEGKFLAMVNGKAVNSPVNRRILLYLDKDSVNLSEIGIFPQIINPSEYALKDFQLEYKIPADFENFSITDYYTIHNFKNSKTIQYNYNFLNPQKELPPTFNYFYMSDNEHTTIELNSTYKGIKNPFKYKASFHTKKLFKENKNERYRDIFDDLINERISNIDICIIENVRQSWFTNLSQDSISKLYIKYRLIYNSEAEEEAEAIPILVEDINQIPWYTRIAIIALSLLSYVGIGIVVNIRKLSYKRYIKIIGIVSGFVFSFLSYYLLTILEPKIFRVIQYSWVLLVGAIMFFLDLFVNFLFKFFHKYSIFKKMIIILSIIFCIIIIIFTGMTYFINYIDDLC